MRILILTQHYDPEPIPKPGELARALKARGHAVTVLTGFPNYPAGRLYKGYRLRLFERSSIDEIDVIRTWLFPYHGRSSLLRILNYLSFTVTPILGGILAQACDVIYVVHPPLTIGVPAIVLSWCKRAPFVYDVQDIWPDSVIETGMLRAPSLMRLMEHFSRFVYRRASLVLAITPPARRRIVESGIDESKVAVPLLWVTDALFKQAEGAADLRRSLGLDGRFVVMFAGNLGVVQRLDVIVEAARRMPADSRVMFVLVGDGMDRERLERAARDAALSNIRFLGRQPFESMPQFLKAADVLLVHLKRTPISDYLVPAKVLTYLAAGRAVLVAMEGPTADLVSRIGAGVVVPPEDPGALAAAAEQLSRAPSEQIDGMGRAGCEYLLGRNSPSSVIDEYERMLMAVVGTGHGREAARHQC